MSELQLEKKERLSNLAKDVLKLDRNTLLVNLRFMDTALSQFRLREYKDLYMATDGEYLVYDPLMILKVFRDEKEASVRDYLHVVMHAIYQHMFIHSIVDHDLWNLACDIAVEKTISDLDLRSTKSSRAALQKQYINMLENKLNIITAQKIYYLFVDEGLSDHQRTDMERVFCVDDHSLWYMSEEQKQDYLGIGSGDNENNENNEDEQTGQNSEQSGDGANRASGSMSTAELEAVWKDISEHVQMDMETFSKMAGNRTGGLIQNLREVNREKYDYESFLRRFAVRGEVMKLDMDEFDYIFYTYGLKLYGNVPLIEPLEYKEVNRIKEFVIAIDTSGSTSGELVQAFVQKTYNILKSTESFFTKINLHIIQCDMVIQEDAKITNQKEFDAYLEHMQIHGLGGTDFVPIFEYVDQLREMKEFENLRGLIYFTDGFGRFPERAPDYETAFVFVDDGFNNYDVPSWAIKLILEKEEIAAYRN